jgi:RNA polymerase sigma-70 factor, ECF subfamily
MSERAGAENEFPGRGGHEAILEFVPGVLAGQSELPRVVAAEKALVRAIVGSDGALRADQKIGIVNSLAKSRPVALPGLHPLLLKFAENLDRFGPLTSRRDIDDLTAAGISEASIIETVAAVALKHFLITLGKGFNVVNSIEPIDEIEESLATRESGPASQPFLPMPALEPERLRQAYAALREQFGFVPNLYRIQSHCHQITKAEVDLLEVVLFLEDHLSRTQKELIVVRVASLNCNTYLVTLHEQVLSLLGTTAEECDQVIDDIRPALVCEADQALYKATGRLALAFQRVPERFDDAHLRTMDFTEAQIIEGMAMAAFTNFLSTVQSGLGPLPDFPTRRTFDPKNLYLSLYNLRPTFREPSIDDPDRELVERVREGETDAFADLVRRHTRRIFGTLFGILGNIDDARDSTQDVFLKAFQNIANFQGRSKFSTWITSIAVNTGTELLRQRKPTESIDDSDDDQGFRPRQIQSWSDNPEQTLEKAQLNDLVRKGVLRLPEKYRVAVLLRDINQLSTEEAAAALNLSIPALKARVLRGRLMLRENLAPHFSRPKEDGNV